MSEPTLNLKMSDLAGEVGSFLGYGAGADNGDKAWADRQSRKVHDILKSGLRQFYFPPLGDNGVAYDWSFLRPTATFALDAAATEIDMPLDFGGVEGQITISADGSCWEPVPVTNEGLVRECAAREPSRTGPPVWAAVAPQKGQAFARSPRSKLLFFPTAERAYTVGLRYYLLPDALTPANPWAYGGAAHAETLLESCLAIAEQRLDDAMGVHTQKFSMMLAASVAMDRKKKGQNLGYNSDRSDHMHAETKRGWWHGNSSVTFNGQQY